ncbi:MAG: hypothetical protein L7F78_26515, partial [Syntrophales bacterium LBB04]|nr:hypothetical protein [Syntrophales bacterium LBB04]
VPVREFVYPQGMPLFYDAFESTEGYIPYFLRDFFTFRQMRNKTAQMDIEGARVLLNFDTTNQQLQLLDNHNCLPRAMFYTDLKAYPSVQQLIQDIDAGGLDYRRQLGVLESDALSYQPVMETVRASTNASNRVFVVEHRPEQYRIGYQVNQPGVIFVSETLYPGWEVTDRRFKVIHAFGPFIGIVVTYAGTGELVLQFNSPTVRTGLVISCATLAGLLGLTIFLWVRRSY